MFCLLSTNIVHEIVSFLVLIEANKFFFFSRTGCKFANLVINLRLRLRFLER